jgi:hypothetical protein
MPSKRVIKKLRKELYKEASNLRSEMLPEPQIIDPDHTNKRMNPDLAPFPTHPFCPPAP